MEESIRIGCFNSVLSSHGISSGENSRDFRQKYPENHEGLYIHMIAKTGIRRVADDQVNLSFSSSSAQPIEVLLVTLIRTSGNS